MQIKELITEHLDIWTSALEAQKSGGRGRRGKKVNGQELYGIKKLRELVLDLAVRGKLVPQNLEDEPASVLLEKIAKEKAQLIIEGKIKKQKELLEIKEEEKPFALPNGWEWQKLGEVGDTNIGLTYSPNDISENGMPVLRSNNIQLGKLDLSNLVRVDKEVSDKVKVQEGDLIICARNGSKALVGKTALITGIAEEMAFGAFMAIFRSRMNNYILCFIQSRLFRRMIDDVNTTTINQITQGNLKNTICPIPPLNEQHRIVAKVDELMVLCDQLEQQQTTSTATHQTLLQTLLSMLANSGDAEDFSTAWERIARHFDILFTTEQSIDQLQQTLLQLAMMGKLVPQIPEDEPASVLLEKIATEKARLIKEGKIKKQKKLPEITEEEKPFALPEGWEWVRVWNIAKLITSGSRDWAKYYSDTGAIFVTMGNLSRGSYELRLENLRYVNPPKSGEGSRTKLEANDLLISITGDVGNLGLIPENFGEAYINQHTCLLRFMPKCHNRFFPELMLSPIAKYQFNAPQRGIKNSFRLGDVGEMIIPLPPLVEQHRIVAKVDELMILCNQLKAHLHENQTTKLQLADTIVKQAIA